MSNYLTGLSQLNPQVKRHNGGGTSLTLDSAGTTNATMLYVNGVAQTPCVDFNVSGATLTTTSTLPSGTNICTTIQYFSTGVVNTVADNAIGLGQMASGVDGNVISYDASGNPVAVATGNDGQVLTSTGAGSPPAFETPAGGGSWTLINTAVASGSANLTVTGINSSTYDTHAFIFSSILPATSGQNLYMRLGTSSGIITATDYLWHVSEVSTGATSWSNQKGEDVAEAKIAIEPTNSSNRGGSGGTIYLTNNNGTNHPTWTGVQASSKVTYMTGGFTMGILTSASNIDRVQIYFQSGNITSGRLSVYGIAHA